MQGHIRQRGAGTWAIVLDVGRHPDGRRNQKWHSVKGSRKDAERELHRLLHEMNSGGYVEPTRLSVGDFLSRWLNDHARVKVSPKTFERYEEIITRHLTPALGHHLLVKLQPLQVQSYYARALREGRLDGKGGLSAQTVLHHHRIFREALQQAVKWRLLARNPVDAVDPPTPVRKAIRILNPSETRELIVKSVGTSLHAPIMLAVSTGMRRGEILALRWENVDLDVGVLSVRETYEQTRAGLRVKEPKTQKGRRTVALGELAVDSLRAHRRDQAGRRISLGPGYVDRGLVFPMFDGGPWKPDSFSRAFIAFATKIGLGGLRFHDLRHGHATQLLSANVHPKIVSERLGHSTIGITLDTYSHVIPGMQEEAAMKADAGLRAALATGT